MPTITISQLNKALLVAVSRTYYKALLQKMPGKGRLADALDISVGPDGVNIYAEDKAGEIINYLNFGTKAHVIEAKNNSFLAFKWPDAPIPPHTEDGTFFFKRVYHPGIEARRFVQEVAEDPGLKNEFERIFKEQLEKMIGVVK